MIRTLQRKFITVAMVAVIIVLSCIMGIINILNYMNVNSSADAKLDLIAENRGQFPEEDDIRKIEPHERISPESPFDTRYFTVSLDNDGNVLWAETKNIAAIDDETAVEYATALFAEGETEGFVGIYKYRAVENDDGTMYIFLDCERELTNFRSFLMISITASTIGVAAVLILVVMFSKAIVRPVAESYEKQKRFITDASHEIKTPLTIIDANTEVLEMENGESEWTASIKNQVKRLTGLTEKLVFLTRMDEPSTVLEMNKFSLSDVILETAKDFEPIAVAKNKKFDIDIESDVTYSGNKETIRQLVSLLLDNAMKYSSAEGGIRLNFKTSERNKKLTVCNTVDEIEKGDLNILFDRFYRGDPSRSSEISGFGIGLSAAQSIVAAHKGKISAKSEDGKSVMFTVIL